MELKERARPTSHRHATPPSAQSTCPVLLSHPKHGDQSHAAALVFWFPRGACRHLPTLCPSPPSPGNRSSGHFDQQSGIWGTQVCEIIFQVGEISTERGSDVWRSHRVLHQHLVDSTVCFITPPGPPPWGLQDATFPPLKSCLGLTFSLLPFTLVWDTVTSGCLLVKAGNTDMPDLHDLCPQMK